MYIVIYESPASTDLDGTVFRSKKKALEKFHQTWDGIEILDPENVEILEDEEDYKVLFYYDGSYGYTVTFKKFELGETFNLIGIG